MLRVAAVAAVVAGAAAQITITGRSPRNGTVIDATWNRPLNVSFWLRFLWVVVVGRVGSTCLEFFGRSSPLHSL